MTRFLASMVVVSALAAAQAAEAQEQEWRAERPYRGLFASGVGETTQLLTAKASVGGGWDDNLVADAIGRNTPLSDVNQQSRGGLGTGSAGLSYSLNLDTVGVGASAGTTVRYYPSLARQFVRREYGSLGASATLGAGFSAHAGATYQPYSLRSMTPWLTEPQLDDPTIADEDFPTSLEHYFGYSGGLDYSRRITSRVTFSSQYSYQGREPMSGMERFDRHTAGASVSRAMSRGLSLQLGYRVSEAGYGDGESHVNHVIDAGVNYNRTLSFSRRTTVSFATGTSASRAARSDNLHYRAVGDARLVHEIGRTWTATLSYNRGLRYVETWPEPVFSDSAVAALVGLIHSRSQVHVAARALHGKGRLGGASGDGLESYSASAGLTFTVTRHINTGVTVTQYTHRFGSDVLLPPGYARDFERRSVRAFVSVWAPLFQRSRTP